MTIALKRFVDLSPAFEDFSRFEVCPYLLTHQGTRPSTPGSRGYFWGYIYSHPQTNPIRNGHFIEKCDFCRGTKKNVPCAPKHCRKAPYSLA